MKKLKKIIFFFPLLLLWPVKMFAFCPLCVVATGFAVGIFRWLGVDDVIVGLWIGAFGLSITLILSRFFVRKGMIKKIALPVAVIIVFSSLLASLYFGGFLKVANKILGIEKIIFGMIVGILILLLAPFMNNLVKKLNGNANLISHQKMITAIILLLIISSIFYFLI